MGTEDTIENILMPNFTGNTDAIDRVDELAPAFTRNNLWLSSAQTSYRISDK